LDAEVAAITFNQGFEAGDGRISRGETFKFGTRRNVPRFQSVLCKALQVTHGI